MGARESTQGAKGIYNPIGATNNRVLEDIFSEIDSLEKTQMDVRHFSHTEDNYMLWAWLAFAFFALELLLRYTVLRTIP